MGYKQAVEKFSESMLVRLDSFADKRGWLPNEGDPVTTESAILAIVRKLGVFLDFVHHDVVREEEDILLFVDVANYSMMVVDVLSEGLLSGGNSANRE